MDQNSIKDFPPEVIEKIGLYVYRLIDPRNGETFYVGKGRGNRVFQHIRCAQVDSEFDEISDKIGTIRKILNAGLSVIHVIHRHGLTVENIDDVEAAVIDCYPNATNIMGGYGSAEFGPMNAFEIISKYAAPEVVFSHSVIMININRSASDNSIYDSTRFAWKINISKAEKADFVFAVEKGIVKGVFIVNRWMKATSVNFPTFNKDIDGRWGFEGISAPDEIQKSYLHKRIPDSFRKKGAANPIKYHFPQEFEIAQ